MRMLLVKADGEAQVRDEEADLATLQRLVGGYIEMFGPTEGAGWLGYCNEEGKLRRLPYNARATTLALEGGWRSGGDFLVGDVVFLGPGDTEGGDTEVTEEFLALSEHVGKVLEGT